MQYKNTIFEASGRETGFEGIGRGRVALRWERERIVVPVSLSVVESRKSAKTCKADMHLVLRSKYLDVLRTVRREVLHGPRSQDRMLILRSIDNVSSPRNRRTSVTGVLTTNNRSFGVLLRVCLFYYRQHGPHD